MQTAHEWGRVYLAQSSILYKIGYTNGSVAQRINSLQTGSFAKIVLALEIPSPNPAQLEREIHARYANKRVRGEWYRLSRQDIYDLRVLASQQLQKMTDAHIQQAGEW